MSRSIDLFIASDRPIEEVAGELARLTQLDLTPGELPGTWSLDESDVHAELHSHPYVDDGELLFESYRYALSARVAQDGHLRDAPQTALLRVVAEALRGGGIATVLVHDLQYRDPVQPRGGWQPAGGDGDALTTSPSEPPEQR